MRIVAASLDDQYAIDDIDAGETTEQDFLVGIAGHVVILRLISPLDHATSEALFDQIGETLEKTFTGKE